MPGDNEESEKKLLKEFCNVSITNVDERMLFSLRIDILDSRLMT